MADYIAEFVGLMAIFSVVIVAPGADTAMVLRQSLAHGRRAGVFTSLGVGVSLLFHVGYTILGIGLIVSQSLLAFNFLKGAGALYLGYVGWKTFFAAPPVLEGRQALAATKDISAMRCFGMGFITNALNPKALLFFLTLFSALVRPSTPLLVQASYGLGMAAALIGWFVLVANFLTIPVVSTQFSRCGRWLNRLTGALFIGLGVKLAFAQSR